MPDLDFKSTFSLKAGEELIKAGIYTQAVHCFYYAVLQLMKFKLAHCSIGKLDYDQQELRIEANKTSTHDWLFKEILGKLNNHSKDSFDNGFHNLKGERKKADYTTYLFDQKQSEKCWQTASTLISIIKTIS